MCFAGLSAAAQGVPNNSLLLATPFASPFTTPDGSNDAVAQPATLPFSASFSAPTPTSDGTLPGTSSLPTGSAVELDPSPQQVQGVFRSYRWQAYAGYTFFRFYETSHPTRNENQNGANWSIVYYWKDWLGIDGEMSATHGHQNNEDSWFLFGGGGPRFRWSGLAGWNSGAMRSSEDRISRRKLPLDRRKRSLTKSVAAWTSAGATRGGRYG